MKYIFSKKSIWYVCFLILAIRLISLALYPLMDTTEARYGEIARLMFETENWITPQFDYNVPFWGKPPLTFWLSALSVKFLGLSEFALRFPHWFIGVATLSLVAFFAYRTQNKISFSVLIVASSAVFIVSAGAIMTDMALTFSLTLAMVGFYLCYQKYPENQENIANRKKEAGEKRYTRYWGYISFIGLALGLLAKGPIIIVLMGVAVFPFLLTQHGILGSFKVLWQRFPLITGSVLLLCIALPWYIMAENTTPGFLDYFIVGEHFKRFLISGWEGDLYGTAHNYPLGTILRFWLTSAAPYSFILLFLFWRKRQIIKKMFKNPLFAFSFFWLCSPLFLFFFAANILPAYVLPGIPALGMLISMLIDEKDYKWLIPLFSCMPIILLIAVIIVSSGVGDKKSDKMIFEETSNKIPVFYYKKRPFSGQFYSQGQAKAIDDFSTISHIPQYYLIGKTNTLPALILEYNLDCSNKFDATSRRTLFLCKNKV